MRMQSEQETLLENHDQRSRDQPWKYLQDFALRRLLSLGCLLKSLWCLGVLLGEVSSSAFPLPLAQLIQCLAKSPGAHQARKEILLSLWLAEEVARGKQQTSIIFTWLLAPSPVHVIPSCAPAQCCYTGSFRERWDPTEKLPIPRASLSG